MQETQEMQVWSLGQEDPLEEEGATHCSFLAWKIPWTEEAGGLAVIGLQRSGHTEQLSTHIGYGENGKKATLSHLLISILNLILSAPHENHVFFIACIIKKIGSPASWYNPIVHHSWTFIHWWTLHSKLSFYSVCSYPFKMNMPPNTRPSKCCHFSNLMPPTLGVSP